MWRIEEGEPGDEANVLVEDYIARYYSILGLLFTPILTTIQSQYILVLGLGSLRGGGSL